MILTGIFFGLISSCTHIYNRYPNKSLRHHKPIEIKVFLNIFAFCWKDLDPGGPKTYGSRRLRIRNTEKRLCIPGSCSRRLSMTASDSVRSTIRPSARGTNMSCNVGGHSCLCLSKDLCKDFFQVLLTING